MRSCPNCGNQVSDTAVFCDQCGTKLPAEEPVVEEAVVEQVVVEEPAGGLPEGIVICPACGAENVPGEIFCDVCGQELETPQPVQAAVEEAVVEPVVEEVIVEEEPVVEEIVVEEEPVLEEAVIEEEIITEEPIAEGDQELYCPICGSTIHPDDTFCGNCGAVLSETVEEELVEEIVVEEPVIEEELVEEAIIEEPMLEEELVEEIVVEEPVIEEELVEEIVPVEEPVAETVVEELHCPICNDVVQAGQAFCANCGAALAPVPEPAVEQVVEPAAAISGGPYFQVASTGAHIPLTVQDELLVGRLDEVSNIYPEVDMTPHDGIEGGVSRRHAKLIHEGTTWFVIDLDSTNGTYLNGTELQPMARQEIQNGDHLSFGDIEVAFYTA